METSLLGRIGFWMLLPAMLLPPIPAILITEAARNWPEPDGFYEVGATVFIGVPLFFIFVLLASMTTNAWLLLTIGWVRTHRSVGTGVAICLIAEIALLVVWSVALGFEVSGTALGPSWLRGLHIAALGLMAAGLAAFISTLLLRREHRGHPVPPLPFAALLPTYAGLSAVAITLTVLGGTAISDTLTGDALHWLLVVLGAPWSLGALLFVPIVTTLAGARTGLDGGVLIRIVLLVPLIVNLTLLVIASVRWRRRATVRA